MKDTLQNIFGLGDGEGNTSLMRVLVLLMGVGWLVTKVVQSVKAGTGFEINNTDLEFLGVVFGAKLIQNVQEAKTPPKTP